MIQDNPGVPCQCKTQDEEVKFLFGHFYINSCCNFSKLTSFVRPMIKNQSIIVQIPSPPQVSNFATPSPVSPIRKRSMPKCPPSKETTSEMVGSLKPAVCNIMYLDSS